MKINETIRSKRKEQGLTQEQAAAALGVSASAVHKWEKGSTYPDITLLPALARLLGVDLNTLLSFQKDLTQTEIGDFCNRVIQVIREQGVDAGFWMAMEKLREYPASDLLLFNVAGTLDGALILFAPDQRERYNAELEALYRRAAESETAGIREQANRMLVSKLMEREDFEGAQRLLERFEAPSFDKMTLQATLYRRQGKCSEAAELLEKKLLNAANECYAALLSLMEIALENQEAETAQSFARGAEQTVRLFGLWEYFAYAAPFELAAAGKDAGQCIALLQKMLPTLQKGWSLSDAPFYRHIRGKRESALFQKQMEIGLLKALETEEEFAFLRLDPKFEQLMKIARQERTPE